MNSQDVAFMEEAIRLAERSRCEPGREHPKVGVVLVPEDGRPVKTYHGQADPCDHAEYIALKKKRLSTRQLVGATVYTTLEPCTVRSPEKVPCAERLEDAEVARVVIGMLDPNQDVCGKGVLQLRRAGVEVELFPLRLMREVEAQNADFSRRHRNKEWIPCGTAVADSEYHYRRMLDNKTRSMIFVGTNLRGLFSEPEFLSLVAGAIRLGCRVTFICATYHSLKLVTDSGARSLAFTVQGLHQLRKRVGKHARRLHAYFSPDAISMAAMFRDPNDNVRGLLVLSPRWAGDTAPRDRPYCVVEKHLHPHFFNKLYGGVLRIVEARGTLNLGAMTAEMRKEGLLS